MTFVLLVVAVASCITFGAVVHTRKGGYTPEPFRSSVCQGHVWHKAYPDHTKEELRQFLLLFTRAFAFRDSEKLQFSPHDRVYEVYRALYPRLGGMDALEFNVLAESVKHVYGVRLENVWSDSLTLGELYAACASHSSRVA